MSFLAEYFDIVEGANETAVCCPFDHYTSSGIPYKESNPSASVNLTKGVFNCMRCKTGLSELQFIEKILGCTALEAKRLQNIFKTHETIDEWEEHTMLSEESKDLAHSMGISDDTLNELKVATAPGTEHSLCFPVFMYGHLIDVRTYNPSQRPKVRSRKDCPSGLIIPYDLWTNNETNRVTVICAGEKDMANARSRGLNAITITGGELALPKTLNAFKDKSVVICYDNDDAGLLGAKKLANALYPYAKYVKIITGFHEVCANEGEDLTDFFVKYERTKQDLVQYFKDTKEYRPSEEDLKMIYPMMDLLTASKPENINKLVCSNIQVVATSEQSFICPTSLYIEKMVMSNSRDGDEMNIGETRDWELKDENAEALLKLVDNNFKEADITANIKYFCKCPKEKGVRVRKLKTATIFKCYVTDMFETNTEDAQPMEFTAYSINCRIESGKKYKVTHKLTPHPYKGQQLVMIITDAVQASDSVSNFTLTEDNIDNLRYFRYLPGNVERKMDKYTEMVKGLLKYDGNNTLIKIIDLWYHTPLQFNFGNFEKVRGYLDVIVVGESRVGKSSTVEALRRTYELGVFTSLAGNSATIPGLVGGSNKNATGFQTRAGIIPQNHKGAICLEEFGKSNANVVTELTDIRSSNEVRITRVAGTITLPAMVRMIALTNPKTVNGNIKPISSYPNGISVISELVSSAEDIARYDIMLVLSDRGVSKVDPFWKPEEPLPITAYQTRIRWVWSRTPEQIIIDEQVGLFILNSANELNQKYDCHIKVFGTEAWKKLARLSIAVAGYLVSTDDSFENIIVTQEHVEYALKLLIEIYDNPTFRLREYVEHERKYTTVDEEAVAALEDIYMKHSALINQLEQCSTTSKSNLGASAGYDARDLNGALNSLFTRYFIKFHGNDVVPTQRFRLALERINRNGQIRRLGES